MRRALCAALLLLATPAIADDTTTLIIDNRSSEPVVRLNTFPIDEEGVPIEDNVGSLMEDIPAGTVGELVLSLARCGRLHIALGLGAGDAERELTTAINTCKSRTLVVSD